MNYIFSDAVASFRSSAIRDLMSLATRSDIISFAGGMPGNELFPVEDLKEMSQNFTRKEWEEAMQYGPTPGNPAFIAALKEFLRKRNFPVDTNELIITTGSLQGLNILAKLFINPNDVVLTENPVFIGGVSAFLSYQANIVGVDLDADGIDIEQLKEAIKLNPKLLYITPNFHNPAGTIYSRERREQLLEVMRGTEIPIIEDDAYGELYFDEQSYRTSRPMKTWVDKEMDRQILYTGSFSKIFGPGLRVAWALVPPEIYEKMQICKQSIDACTPTMSQVFAQKFMETGKIEPYIEQLRAIYKKRRDYTLAAIEKYLPKEATFVKPQGGFYLWIKMPKGVDEVELFKKVIERGAVFVLGSVFHPHAEKNGRIRVSYCNTPEEQIDRGIKIIGEAMKEMMIK
jgi:DNA-binding transcriptional MocR family regulator